MATEWNVLLEIFPHLKSGEKYFSYSVEHPVRYIPVKQLPKSFCFARFGDGHLHGTYPEVEIVGFYACNKNFGCYNMHPSKFPDAKVFIIYSSPAEYYIQSGFKEYSGKIIVDFYQKRFFEGISDKITIVKNGDELRNALEN